MTPGEGPGSVIPPAGRVDLVVRNHLRFLDASAPLPPDANLRDLGLDSLAAIDLLLDLEQTFGVLFPDELLTQETFQTAANLADAVARLTRSMEAT
jgi:acyl carrier protein